MFRSATAVRRAVLPVALCAMLLWPASGAAQTSLPVAPAGPPVAAPAAEPAAPESPEGADPTVCFSNYTGGASPDFSSVNSQAVQSAINAASAGGTVKLAGVCAGVVSYGGSSQVGLITKTLTVIGGYAFNNWAVSYPITQPTILDAQGGGRVLKITSMPVSVFNLTAQMGKAVNEDGGAIWASGDLDLANVVVLSSTTNSDGGGVASDGALRLVDTRIISNTASQSGGGAKAGGSMTVVGGLFERNVAQHGGGARAFSTLVMTDTHFINNHSSSSNFSGGGLKADREATLNGGRFEANTGYRGAAFSGGGTASISGTHVISNTAVEWGGGANIALLTQITSTLWVSNTSGADCGALRTPAILRATASAFHANTTNGNGGAACADNGGVHTGGVFQDNMAAKGGGLWTNGSTTLSGMAFISNTATVAGGGAYLESGAAIASGGVFEGNQAIVSPVGSAGGLYAAALTMTDTRLISNSAAIRGGGAYVAGSASIIGAQFIANQVSSTLDGQGGGLYSFGALTATDASFRHNVAGYSGGGARAIGPALIAGGVFEQNSAPGYDGNGGGGGLNAGGAATISGTRFLTNSGYFGGGIYSSGPLWMTGGLLAGNSAAGAGGGADLEGGGSITRTLIENNRCGGCGTYGGGGVWSWEDLSLHSVRFVANTTGGPGGGLAFGIGAGARTLIAVNSLFAANGSPAGAAIAAANATSIQIVHATIASPTQAPGSAIYIAYSPAVISNTIVASHTTGIEGFASTVVETHNLFFGNGADTAGTVTGGAGSFMGDPRFVNPAAGDYHLTPLSAARDAGANAGVLVDFEGDARPIGGGFDIGYDESRARLAWVPTVRR